MKKPNLVCSLGPLLLVAVLSGCDQGPGLTNEQIISEVKKCTDAGMKTRVLENGWTYKILKVQCLPKPPHDQTKG